MVLQWESLGIFNRRGGTLLESSSLEVDGGAPRRNDLLLSETGFRLLRFRWVLTSSNALCVSYVCVIGVEGRGGGKEREGAHMQISLITSVLG
jgi:hypothetical protein